MVDRHGQKPECLLIGLVGPDAAASRHDLQRYAERAEAAGCQAIRVSRGRGLAPADIEDLAHRWLGRLAVALSVSEPSAVAEAARMGGIAMLAVPAPAATDPRLVARVAETGLAALVDVTLLSSASIEETARRFAPGQLTLMWNQIRRRGSPLETVDDLFALVRLRRYGLPVGYVGMDWDPLAVAVALGFGAVVLEAPLDDPDRTPVWGGADAPGLAARLQQAQQDPDGEFLRASDLDLVEEARPSLVAARPIRRGETLTAEMIACKPPFRGLSPGLLSLVIGRRALYEIAQDEAITFGIIDL